MVLMHLSDVKFDGETIFRNAELAHLQVKDDTWSDCAKKGLAVQAVKGDAVLFFSLNPDGTTDPKSLPGSCPVIKGEKWSAPKWIHVGLFGKPYVSPDDVLTTMQIACIGLLLGNVRKILHTC